MVLVYLAIVGISALALFLLFRKRTRARGILLLLLLAGVLVMVINVPRIKQFVEIDRCLDSGGRWNYENKVCEGATAAWNARRKETPALEP